MPFETKLKNLEKDKKILEELLQSQYHHVSSKFEHELEQQFWHDRQSRIIHMIIRATKPICIYFFLFMCLSLTINYFNADPKYLYHDIPRNVMSFISSWIGLLVTFFIARQALLHKYFVLTVASVVLFALLVNFSVHLSMQTVSLAWRGTIICALGIIFIYICSGLRPRVIFFSSMLAGIFSFIYLKLNYTSVPVWVIVNTLVVPNLVGLALASLSISNERIRFLQSHIIEYDKQIYSLMNKNLTEISHHDSLTNLRNRRGFEPLIKSMMFKAQTMRQPFAILFIDVDHFKLYNDNYGHDAGDKALVMIAEKLSHNIRKNDIAMRFGGEEFVILLDQTTLLEAEDVAKRIIDSVLEAKIPHAYSTVSDYLTVSIGITLYSGESVGFSEILQCADHALYMAKKNGRNQYQISKLDEINLHH